MNVYWDQIKEMVGALNGNVRQAIHEVSVIREAKKGDYLLKEGEICKGSFFIEKGITRKFYLIDGKEITSEFFFEGDLAASMRSYVLHQPSMEYIQAITEAVVVQTDHDAFEGLKERFPELHEFDLRVNELYAMYLEERLHQLQTMTATERYQLLAETYPNVIQHIPLTYIASYLGVSLETLSRIRAKF
jgi:CRP-like cAMP-binding protein